MRRRSISAIGDDPANYIATQAVLELGAPRQGEIDPTFDAEWYRVELIEGQSYHFELRADASRGRQLSP
jgi:hypothetical protein